MSWRDLDEVAAEERVLRGESLLVVGIAGTGKTTYVQGLVERLRHSGKRADVVSKMHTASRRAGGVTADHWARRHILHGSATCDFLWIDDISKVDVGLLNQIAKLSFTLVRFILSGDFHQFPPISDCERGSPVPEESLERSALLCTLAGGSRCTLTECRRGDRRLFNFYSSLVDGPRAEPVHQAVAQAKATFRASGPARWNLVISHRKRIQLNMMRNRAEAPPDAVFVELSGRPARGNGAQSMLLWPGIQLYGCTVAERRGVMNGCLYTVESIDAEAQSLTLEGVEGAMTFEQAKVCLRLSYAQTYASCQGTEFGGSLRRWDCAHKLFTRLHLFVGLSRAKQDAEVSLQD
jgi:hypothetical protein